MSKETKRTVILRLLAKDMFFEAEVFCMDNGVSDKEFRELQVINACNKIFEK